MMAPIVELITALEVVLNRFTKRLMLTDSWDYVRAVVVLLFMCHWDIHVL